MASRLMHPAPRGIRGKREKMSKLEMVYVATSLDAYGMERYTVKTKCGNYVCREDIGNRKMAYEIAERIDADMLYEREHGAGSLDTF